MTAAQTLSEHRQHKHDVMVQKILDTARSIMREQGVAALSMNELARRLDMRPPSLYHYFAGKMDLYDTLFRVGFSMYAEELEKISQEAGTWQEYVKRIFTGYLGFAKENPDLYQLCFERPVPGFVPSAESLQLSVGMLQHFYQFAGEMKKTIRTDLTAQQLVDLLIAVMHGITAMHMSNEPDYPTDQGRFGPLIPIVLDLLEKTWI
jgi:AcrR family transcriptional regulator